MHAVHQSAFDASQVVRSGDDAFAQGRALADALLDQLAGEGPVHVDVRHVPPQILISAFFFAFMEELSSKLGDSERANKIVWEVAHDFQQRLITQWVQAFEADVDG